MSKNENKVVFKTAYVKCDVNNSNTGDPYINKYGVVVNKEGARVLKITDKVNGQDIIDSFADSCDINNVVRSMSVDTFNKLVDDLIASKHYVDMTKMPTNIFEFQNYILDLKNKFETMPGDLKSMFNNNANYFAKCCEDGSALDICNKFFTNVYDSLDLRQKAILNSSGIQNSKEEVVNEK